MGVYRLNKEEVLAEIDVAEMTLRNLIKNHGFPHPRKAGPQKLFWLVSEIVTWLECCPKARESDEKRAKFHWYGAPTSV